MQAVRWQVLDDDAFQLAQLVAFLSVMLGVGVDGELSAEVALEKVLYVWKYVLLLIFHVRGDVPRIFVVEFHYQFAESACVVYGLGQFFSYEWQLETEIVFVARLEVAQQGGDRHLGYVYV